MKKYMILGLLTLCCSFTANARQYDDANIRSLDRNNNGIYEEGEVNPGQEYQCGPCTCYCPVVRFKPEYYCETHCVDEPYTVQKKCCRMVDQTYTKTHCRMVPQYYTKEYCRKVPQYYCVPETRCRKRYIKEQKCRYIPCKTIKKTCSNVPVCPACPKDSNSNCSTGSCPTSNY